MVIQEDDWRPSSSSDRVAAIDIIRGLALFGVLIVNILSGFRVPLLEHINFPDALNADGTLKYTHLVYTDPFPFTGTPQTMPACKVDPRSSSDPTQLSSSPVDYTNSDNAGAVLPTGATSCVISLTTSGTVASGGSLDAEVYSDVDGLRQPG